jgi:hypothetical protein
LAAEPGAGTRPRDLGGNHVIAGRDEQFLETVTDCGRLVLSRTRNSVKANRPGPDQLDELMTCRCVVDLDDVVPVAEHLQ